MHYRHFSSSAFSAKPCSTHHLQMVASNIDVDTLGLPPKLLKTVKLFRDVPNEKLRYQQLLFLASKLEPMPEELKIPENKVQGCLSTVHVHATTIDGKIYLKGDSDGQLTKGLVALLINGLEGCTAEEVNAIQPEFLKYAGIAASLTPGRNNGFLNMLALIKKKASQLDSELQSDSGSTDSSNESETPMYTAMINKLSMLKPIKLELVNESSKHAGHAAMQGVSGTETHFNLKIVASCFENMSLVQRHKMVYALVAEELKGGVHALSIVAKTPDEDM